KYDPDKAEELVDEAGVEGEEFTFTAPNPPYAKAIAEIVSVQREEVGLKANTKTQEFPAVWLDKTFTEHDFDMSVINHAEPRDILTVFSKDYYIGYDDSKIKKIAEKADTGTEGDYIAGMKEIARTITDDAASDFLFLFPNLVIAKSDIAGIPANRVSDAFRIADLSWNWPHGSMLTCAISRATQCALSLTVASVVVCALMSLLPGNAAQVALGTNATPEAVAALEAQYGLDRPPAIRYFDWMIGMA